MELQKICRQLFRVAGVVCILFGLTASGRFSRPAKAAPAFRAGSLVVYRVGDGSGSLVNTGSAVFLDEYAPDGTLVQSIAVPTVTTGANRRLIASGTATSEGLLTRSDDGQYLIITGYDAPIPTTGLTTTAATSVPRVVGRIDAGGNIDTSTALTDFASGGNPRGATSTNGTDLWMTGSAGGVRYASLGASSSTQLSTAVTNLRDVRIFGGQLYISTSSGTTVRVGTVGTGTPTTSGQTISNLPGFPTAGSPYGFFLADLDGVPGVDTLYVADDTTSGIPGGITKYSLISGAWISNGAAGLAADSYRGLAGIVNGTSVTLYATRRGGSGATGGGQLVSFVDSSGFNGAFAGTPALLATAANNTAFRGVAPAPAVTTVIKPTITTQPVSKTINSGQSATLSVVAGGTAPLSFQWYVGDSGATTNPIANATSTTFTTPVLSTTTKYWVRVTNTGGSADSNTATITVVTPPPPCSTAFIPIHDVQGSGETSPLAGQTVSVRGVVIGDYEGPPPALRGFYLQDRSPDADPATSEGIFIFEATNADTLSLGKVVQVTGGVEEFQGQTEINAATVEDCGTTAAVTPIDVTLPVPPDVNGVSYLERFEGMLVRFHQTLYVTEHFQLDRFGQIVMSSNARLPQPTSIVSPGAAAIAQQTANDLNRIIVDDDSQSQNPDPIRFGRGGNPLSASNTLRGGDSATDITGVMTFGWAGNSAGGNAYRLRPINAMGGGVPNFQPTNPRPPGPPAIGGRLKVAGMNVLNYFLTLDNGQSICGPIGSKQQCRGANTATELSRQQQKLNQALLKIDADIIGMSELENSQDAQGNDVNPLADIVTRLNASAGTGLYTYVNTGIVGTDTVRVGIIYKPAKVTPAGTWLVDNNPVHNRPPVAQLFLENSSGERFSVVVNHFRSKGCSSSAGPGDLDSGDGQGCFNARRVQQATALVSFVNSTVIPATGDPDVLLIGDFNSYAKEDPIRTIEQAGFTNIIPRFAGVNAYSYVFDGEWGYIDHGLGSSSLLTQVAGAGDYHINADEPAALDYNTDFKSAGQVVSLFNVDEFRIADHDPVIIGLNLRPPPKANADTYHAEAGTVLDVGTAQGVLNNDSGGALSILSYTKPNHGTLTVNGDGSFKYTAAPGYFGPDSFNYTVTSGSVLQVYSSNVSPLATIGGVNIGSSGYGSALTPVPGSPGEFYGLTDRGPNVDGPNGTKVEPIPAFVPSIGRFKLSDNTAALQQMIPLKAADGTPYSGRANTLANSGETITDLTGKDLPPDPNGYDPEGLVALPDGSFWVSDEYGPFITHFDAAGKELFRLSPFDGSLPGELSKRLVNRGMEGLTVTPDGTTLVGAMQSALNQTDLAGFDPRKLAPVRIVTYRIGDGVTHEYLYLLDNPDTTKTAISEITALSNTTYLIDESDGNFPPAAYKKLFRIDISGATDVGPLSNVPGTTYEAANGGLLIGGKTLELLVKNLNTSASATTLAGYGIAPVSKALFADVTALLTGVDLQGKFFSHDKLEGLAALNDGATLVISNDSDFGIDGVSNSTPPFQLHAKVSPATGQQDEGEFLVIDAIRSTAAVTLNIIDTIAPETTLFSTPPNPAASAAATFTFGATDGGSGVARFECALDNGTFLRCASGVNYNGLADGAHIFFVRAIDVAGNVDTTPATYSWFIQLDPQALANRAIRRLQPDALENKKVADAITAIQDSLSPELWLDTYHLDPKKGDRVFSDDKYAVEKLKGIGGAAQAAILDLLQADGLLASRAIADARTASVTDSKKVPEVRRKIDDAQSNLDEAVKETARGNEAQAVDRYRRAWNDAQLALTKAAGK